MIMTAPIAAKTIPHAGWWWMNSCALVPRQSPATNMKQKREKVYLGRGFIRPPWLQVAPSCPRGHSVAEDSEAPQPRLRRYEGSGRRGGHRTRGTTPTEPLRGG